MHFDGGQFLGDGELRHTCSALHRASTSRMIDKNASHELRGHTKELIAIVPVGLALIDQPNINFVYKRAALKSVIGSFPPQYRRACRRNSS